jgi:hypothetical protein
MMKQAAGLLGLVCLLLGCGGDDGNANFATDYAAEIQKDCNESVRCFQQRDQQLEPDPFSECIKDSSAALEGNAEKQASFMANYNRCSNFIVCDYYDCASSGASTYADSQKPRLEYLCQAESTCRSASGMPDTNPMGSIASCIYVKTGDLNVLTADQQKRWETAVARCSNLMGCEFTNCFATAMAM